MRAASVLLRNRAQPALAPRSTLLCQECGAGYVDLPMSAPEHVAMALRGGWIVRSDRVLCSTCARLS